MSDSCQKYSIGCRFRLSRRMKSPRCRFFAGAPPRSVTEQATATRPTSTRRSCRCGAASVADATKTGRRETYAESIRRPETTPARTADATLRKCWTDTEVRLSVITRIISCVHQRRYASSLVLRLSLRHTQHRPHALDDLWPDGGTGVDKNEVSRLVEHRCVHCVARALRGRLISWRLRGEHPSREKLLPHSQRQHLDW